MRVRLKIWPMKALSAFCLTMGAMPLFILPCALFMPDSRALWALLPICACLWGCLSYLFPSRGRLPFTLLGCALLIAWGVVFQLPLDWKRLICLLPCMAVLLALPPAWSRPAWQEWPAGAWFAGALIHLAAQFLSSWPMFPGTGPMLTASLAVYLLLFLFYMNRHSLMDGMHGLGKAPGGIRRRNSALVLVLFFVSLVVSLWSQLAQWLVMLWNGLLHAIGVAVAFLMSLLPVRDAGGGGGGGSSGMLEGLEEAEPSALALFLEKVFRVLAIIILSALVFLALRALAKGAKKLWKRLMERLRQYAADAGEDYVDEEESTIDWDEQRQSLRRQLENALKREKAPRWDGMNGRERVRYLYRQYLRKRPENKNKTAREALTKEKSFSKAVAQSFAELYEQARYSEENVSAQEAEEMRKAIKG